MKDYIIKVKRLEQETGVAQDKSYVFLCSGYRSLEDYIQKGNVCFKRGQFKGKVSIWEMRGKSNDISINSASAEGIRILKDHGYEIIDSSVVNVLRVQVIS